MSKTDNYINIGIHKIYIYLYIPIYIYQYMYLYKKYFKINLENIKGALSLLVSPVHAYVSR